MLTRSRSYLGQECQQTYSINYGCPAIAQPVVTANPGLRACAPRDGSGVSITLSATGSGAGATYVWNGPGVNNIVNPWINPTLGPGSYDYTVVGQVGACFSPPRTVTVTIDKAVTQAVVGGAQTIPANGTTAPLGGNSPGSGEAGQWTSGVDGSFTNPAAPSASWTPPPAFTGTAILTWTISSTARGSTCASTSASVSVTVQGSTCPTISFSPSTLPNGKNGSNYVQAVTPGGGTAPYTMTVVAGALPNGLNLTPSGGQWYVLGLPNLPGTFNFTLLATDAAGCTGSQTYTITITQ